MPRRRGRQFAVAGRPSPCRLTRYVVVFDEPRRGAVTWAAGWTTLGAVQAQLLELLVSFAATGVDRVVLAVAGPMGETSFVAGASPQGPIETGLLEDVSRTVVRAALTAGTTVTSDGLDDPLESVAELRIARAIATPVLGMEGAALYADVRSISAVRLLVPEALEALAVRIAERPRAPDGADLEAALLLPGLAPLAPTLRAWARSEVPLLLLGEPGVGKTHLALALARAIEPRPVVRATLGASDDLNTITSELFGHERGAFSGATLQLLWMANP
jgi:hypothetical protein